MTRLVADRSRGGPQAVPSPHMPYRIMVNGQARTVDAPAETPVLWALRDDLGLTGTKFGCGIGSCGACTVHLDGQPARACSLPISAVGDKRITTIEGLVTPIMRALQRAWIAEDAPQCGYCQSGQLMSAAALLARVPKPSDADIDSAMAGNICRCGAYQRVRRAIHRAAASR